MADPKPTTTEPIATEISPAPEAATPAPAPAAVPAPTPTASKKKPWADGPFPLISTPAKLTGDYTDIFSVGATHMALVHNTLLRGLNAIYLQAPQITKPVDISDFLGFCKCWSSLLHLHHNGEETVFFKKIEEATGVPGIMDVNISQHKLFHDGMSKFDEYITSSAEDTSTFSGAKLVEIIDTFGTTLQQHLSDEIPTLLALREYGAEKVPIDKISDEEADHALGTAPKWTILAVFAVCFDRDFEDGIHASFPPAPWFVKLLLRYVFPIPYRRYWRFAPCTGTGRRKDLPFAVEAPPVLPEVVVEAAPETVVEAA